MNDKPKNKLFAIVQNTWSHPDLGYTVPHIFGAIFDLDEDGKATDFHPIDFDGKYIHEWKRNSLSQSDELRDHFAYAERALFFPVSVESAERMQSVMSELASEQCAGRNPAYFAGVPLKKNVELEASRARVRETFVGPNTHVSRLHYQRLFDGCAPAATNCMQFLQDMLEKVGGVPLGNVLLEGESMPRQGDTYAMREFLSMLAGNKGKNYMNRTNGRLVDLAPDVHAYAFDETTGSITIALNSLPKQRTADGREVTLAKFLTEESAPFYDPTLNAHDLGRQPVVSSFSR